MTPATDYTHLIWFISGGGFLLAGLVVVVWALFWDRARGRKRCPACAYSMEGAPTLTCPECGRIARSERSLLKTRRQWIKAGIGLLSMALGVASATFPIVRAKNPWMLVPHPVVAWFAARPALLDEQHHQDLLTALLKPSLTRAEYERVIRVKTRLMYDRTALAFVGGLDYRLGTPRPASDGSIPVRPWPEFVWNVSDEPANAYSLLSDATAVEHARALAYSWGSDLTHSGQRAGRQLWILAYWKPAVARWALERLFEEPTGWMVYAVDPRSDDGAALRALLAAYKGSDPVVRARAAAVLADSYFNVNTHWHSPSNLGWIEREYPDYRSLAAAAKPAGDDLLRIALEETGERQRLAVLSLLDARVTWQEQWDTLCENVGMMPTEFSWCPQGTRPVSNR